MLWISYSILCSIVCLKTNQIAAVNDNSLIIKKTVRSGPASAQNPLLFDHIFVLIMENRGHDQTLSSPAWQSIIHSSAWLTGMYAITHPSQPNYVSMMAGSTLNCKDNNYCSTNETTIIDLLNRAGVSWKSYQENYTPLPTITSPNCNDAIELSNGLYVRRHNPFMFSAAVRNNTTECQKIVNADQLAIDLANQELPQFSFYTPNIKNDAHDTDLIYAGNYLKNWLNIHLNDPNFMRGTLLIVTFDEDESNPGQTNHIPALMWGTDYLYSAVKIPGKFNLYSLPKLLEDNWGLGNLGRQDVTASSLMDIWRLTSDSNNTTIQTTSISTILPSKASRKDIVWNRLIIVCCLIICINMIY
ncbi:unnamed protein product [Adineta steineri]|uniref:Phosphoesterase family-domain-containing protein n=1 Tax=Adineta steineri TaxID=433720 RepID=A0A815EV45_9BILA|nr:unnamed protein product [Adineta steineri]CAF3764629.1 unnamed protein product [Adineta steineri]